MVLSPESLSSSRMDPPPQLFQSVLVSLLRNSFQTALPHRATSPSNSIPIILHSSTFKIIAIAIPTVSTSLSFPSHFSHHRSTKWLNPTHTFQPFSYLSLKQFLAQMTSPLKSLSSLGSFYPPLLYPQGSLSC